MYEYRENLRSDLKNSILWSLSLTVAPGFLIWEFFNRGYFDVVYMIWMPIFVILFFVGVFCLISTGARIIFGGEVVARVDGERIILSVPRYIGSSFDLPIDNVSYIRKRIKVKAGKRDKVMQYIVKDNSGHDHNLNGLKYYEIEKFALECEKFGVEVRDEKIIKL